MDKFADINRALERDASGHAYKGYLARFNALQSLWQISADGFHITSCASLEEAKRQIDALAGE